MAPKFLNDREDLAWLREVHCPDAPEFKSFTIEGNEDAPDRVMLYADVCPTVFDVPVDVYVPNLKGTLVGRPPAKPPKPLKLRKLPQLAA